MKRLFLFLLTAIGLYAQNQNVTVQPSPGSGGMNTGTFNTYGINYYLAKPATTWDFTQATVLLPQSISGVLSINAGPGIGVNNNTGTSHCQQPRCYYAYGWEWACRYVYGGEYNP